MNPRELLQSAQAAEREGDLARAVSLLEQAAQLYEETGHPSRAAQMRRQVERLAPGGASAGLPAVAVPEREPAWDLGPGLVERTPTLADPALEAWCSFCCRPAREVGRLVAGPAQAFICRAYRPGDGLLAASGSERSSPVDGRDSGGAAAAVPGDTPPATTLSFGAPEGAVSRPASARSADLASLGLPRRLAGGALEALRTQRGSAQRIEEALAAGHARVLLVGPTGSGKSTWLRHWAERGLGSAWDGTGSLPEEGALLVDDVDRLEPPARRALARALPTRSVVLSLDATLPAPGKEIDGRRVHGSDEVDSVAGEWLPGSVLDGLTLETFELPGVEELRTLADRWRAPDGSGATREAREEALRVAESSPRRAHALHALLLRWWASR